MTDDDLIDAILKGLCKQTFVRYFSDLCKETIGQQYMREFDRLVYAMKDKGLIAPVRENETLNSASTIRITDFGQQICNKNGWLEYLKQLANSEGQKQEVERLQKENLELSNANYKYEEASRNQKDRIRNLEERLLELNLLRQYWWVLAIAAAIGLFLGASGEQKLHLLDSLLQML